MQYTGHSEYSEDEPPTYACVGESDGIASWRTVYFLFQGAGPEKWMMDAGEYTMKRFAGLYGMRYAGMATNRSEAVRLSEKLG